jgi:hypothetical protein
MGLDMYLTKHSYVKNWEHMNESERHTVTVKKGDEEILDIKPERVSYIIEEVAYWRKFNALHGWFVNNLADGVDNCQQVFVSEDNLEELHGLLLKVQEVLSNAKVVETVHKDWNGKEYPVRFLDCKDELDEMGFAPTEGFFFGSQDINDYFKNDVDETVKIIGDILVEIKENEKNGILANYYYQASW